MDQPKPLDGLFKGKLFRIPDYQRGYAWGREQWDAFWDDLTNLPDRRSHYTGVLTLNEIPPAEVQQDTKEFWLVDDHSYKLYHIVDGQQRLTTFMLFLQAFIELLRCLPDNHGQPDDAIYLTDTLSIADVESKFLFKVKPARVAGEAFRTYKFGYTVDNPSYEYMRYRILGEEGAGTISETFYTLNLSNGKSYFKERLRACHKEDGISSLQRIYRTLTKRFLFNEYIIKDEFDVFVAFETMNNRGKTLSDLELLKNRLIYLTTLYSGTELDPAERRNLRELINDAWKEVYFQLGRNKLKPLNDDEFLRAHWMMYFKYSRQTGRDYIKFLLEEQFRPQRVHRKIVPQVELEEAEEQTSDADLEAADDNGPDEVEGSEPIMTADLRPNEIRDYVKSLKTSSVHWFHTFHPGMSDELAEQEVEWIQRLNRLGTSYFRPLLMGILKNFDDPLERIGAFKAIERFLFVVFRLTQTRSNYRSSEFSNAVRAIDRGEMDLAELNERLRDRMSFTFTDDGHFASEDFYLLLQKRFENGQGYYGWSGLRYFLYEYELELLADSRQKKVDWEDLLKTPRDTISIEHIYPQSETAAWKSAFASTPKEERKAYRNSLGNLLLLSSAINSSLQNDAFVDKKKPRYTRDGRSLRNGYADGSHSEIEVSRYEVWGPEEIRERGIRLLRFMERRWDFQLADDRAREKLLFIGNVDGEKPDGEDAE